jgi:hypothetical protein
MNDSRSLRSTTASSMHSGSLRSEAFIEGSTVAAAAMTWYQERHELEIKVRIRNTV